MVNELNNLKQDKLELHMCFPNTDETHKNPNNLTNEVLTTDSIHYVDMFKKFNEEKFNKIYYECKEFDLQNAAIYNDIILEK